MGRDEAAVIESSWGQEDEQRARLFLLLQTGMHLSEVADVMGVSYESAKNMKEEGWCCNGGPITADCKGCKQ